MPNYTKLFNSIVTSTIWTEDDKTRILWITMLAMSDQNGEVHASIPGLARIAGIDIPSVEKALDAFMSPDPYSRTPDNEGRRIAKIDGGWELLNHAKYRKMASKEDSKAATAERVRRHRERNAPVTLCNAPVTEERDIAEAEAEADTKEDIKKNKRKKQLFSKPTIEQIESYSQEIKAAISAEKFHDYYEAKGWVVGRSPMKDWKAAVRTWKGNSTVPAQKSQLVASNDQTMERINAWFRRKPGELWTIEEKRAWDSIPENTRGEAQVEGMEWFYGLEETAESLNRRTSLLNLLTNWRSELDKARAYSRKQNQ